LENRLGLDRWVAEEQALRLLQVGAGEGDFHGRARPGAAGQDGQQPRAGQVAFRLGRLGPGRAGEKGDQQGEPGRRPTEALASHGRSLGKSSTAWAGANGGPGSGRRPVRSGGRSALAARVTGAGRTKTLTVNLW